MSKKRLPPSGAQFIEPDAYPQILSKPAAARALLTLRSAETAAKAQAAADYLSAYLFAAEPSA